MPLTDADLQSLPKVELHVHLEGTVSASTAAALARDHGEDPLEVLEVESSGNGVRYPTPFTDFDQFVRAFVATSGQLRTADDLERATAAFAAGQRQQSVVWTEATFTATPPVSISSSQPPKRSHSTARRTAVVSFGSGGPSLYAFQGAGVFDSPMISVVTPM